MMLWTKEQELAIHECGKNIIVSAGAGSGKTAVLSERVLKHLENGIKVNQLLVLTFTNLAAKEMKERIRKKIKKNPSLKEQLDLLDSSYISTFDSYALSMVKKHHYLLNISKNVNIIEKSILDIKQNEIIDKIFLDLYDEENPLFLKFINDFTIKDDKIIKDSIIRLNDKLNMKYNRIEYLKNYFNVMYEENEIDKHIDEYIAIINDKVKLIKSLEKQLEDYVDSDYSNKIHVLLYPLLSSNNYDEYKRNCMELKLPSIKRGTLEYGKVIKGNISDLIKEIKRLTPYDNIQDIKKTILLTKDSIRIIVEILNRLDRELNKYKYENDLYDFLDISKLAIKIVKDYPDVQASIKSSFYEILIDEYQDTNDLQEEFIQCINNNNVYMVGDIKQSIYRFRNANPNIFKEKYDKYSNYSNGIKIDLLQNFRSRAEVLNNINLLFDFVMDNSLGGAEYVKSHRMIFGNNSYNDQGKTKQNNDFEIYNYSYDKHSIYTKTEIESFIIAKDIKNKIDNHYQVFDKDIGVLRDITYDDIVILIDRTTSFDLYKKIFEYHNIPLNIYKDDNLRSGQDIYVIKNMFVIMKSIKENNYDKNFEHAFLSIGRSFLYEYDDNYLLKTIANKSYQETDIMMKLNAIVLKIDELSIDMIIDLIIENFNMYEKLIKLGDIDNSIVRLDYLKKISEILSNIGYTYFDFINYVDELFSSNIDVKISLNKENKNSVKIMTIHKSKGLEYNICYFPGLNTKFNLDDIKEDFIFDNDLGIITPYFNNGIGEIIYKEIYKNNYHKEDISERIRLFYVALTRAKEKMILVTNLEDEIEEYDNDIVSLNKRLGYVCFKNILESIRSKIEKYIVNIDLNSLQLSRKYLMVNEKNIFQSISKKSLPLQVYPCYKNESNIVIKNKFSKETMKLLDKHVMEMEEKGNDLHYILENLDFKNPRLDINNPYYQYIVRFLQQPILYSISDAKIYQEYEFINQDKHGVIDLMLEYSNHIDIIDYKLKNINDEAYIGQLKGYKNYIYNKTKKEVNVYLYSLINSELKEIN